MPTAHANGIDIEYRTEGDPADPVLFLVMGLGGQLIAWPQGFVDGVEQRIVLQPPRTDGSGAGGDHGGPCAGGIVEPELDLSLDRDRHQAPIKPASLRNINRTNTYIVKHSSANGGNPRKPGSGISKSLTSSMIGTV